MTKQQNTIQAAAVHFCRLIGTTDMKMARHIGEIIDVQRITGGHGCDISATREGTICLWFNYELYEVRPEVMAV
jgi:hypothetical protein